MPAWQSLKSLWQRVTSHLPAKGTAGSRLGQSDVVRLMSDRTWIGPARAGAARANAAAATKLRITWDSLAGRALVPGAFARIISRNRAAIPCCGASRHDS